MLTVFGAMAELEREYILGRQAEGIAIAKERGKLKGKPKMVIDETAMKRECKRWRDGQQTATETSVSGLPRYIPFIMYMQEDIGNVTKQLRKGFGTTMKAKKPKAIIRQSNFELLRIVSMVMIIAHHIAVHSGFDFPVEVISVNRIWIQFLRLGGKIGVDIYILISGYFLVSSDKVRINKALRFWIQLFTYSVSIFVVLVIILKTEPFSITEAIKSLLPLSLKGWWFSTSYFALYLLHPYINRLLLSFDRMQYKRYLVLILCVWCVIPTFLHRSLDRNNLAWFIVLYSIAGYYKLYGKDAIDCNAGTPILASLLVMLLTFLSAVVLDVIGTRIPFVGKHATWFFVMDCLPILLTSVLMFIGFDKLKIKPNKMINTIASATFGVYLIHDHRLGGPFLWKKAFNIASFSDSNILVPYTLMVIVIVFVACTIIELVRKNTLERIYLKPIDRLSKLLSFVGNKIAQTEFFEKI